MSDDLTDHPLHEQHISKLLEATEQLGGNPKFSSMEQPYTDLHVNEEIRITLDYSPVAPGSLCFRFGSWNIGDDKEGNVLNMTGGYLDGKLGVIDYETGEIRFTHSQFKIHYKHDVRTQKEKLMDIANSMDEKEKKIFIFILKHIRKHGVNRDIQDFLDEEGENNYDSCNQHPDGGDTSH